MTSIPIFEYQKLRHTIARYSKSLILLPLLIASLLTVYLQINLSVGPLLYSMVDTSWVVELSEQLKQGNLLGRDTHFTIGPLSQVFAWVQLQVQGRDALSAFPLHGVLGMALGLVLLCVILCLIDEMDWVGSAVAFFLMFILMLQWFWRPVWALAATVLLSRALGKTGKQRFVYTGLAALSGFIGQLISLDSGVLALLAGSLLVFFWIGAALVLQRRRSAFKGLETAQEYVKVVALFWSSYLILNLGLEIYFKSTAPLYNWFDMWRYGWIQISRYGYGLALDWLIDYPAAQRPLLTLAIMILIAYVAAFVATKFRDYRTQANIQILYTFTGLMIFAIVNFKSATLRSDVGHVLRGSVGLIFLLCLSLGAKTSSRNTWLVGICILVLLIGLWPSNMVASLEVWPKIFRQQNSFSAKWEAIRNFEVNPALFVPAGLPETLGNDKWIVSFPFNNVVAVALKRYSFAPVLQTELAFNSELQEMFVQRVTDNQSNIEVVYGLDVADPTTKVVRMNGVQNISRVPIIFEYLAENFTLKAPNAFGDYLVLKPRASALPLQRTPLAFHPNDNTNLSADLTFETPQTCPLIELEIQTDYPAFTMLGRANGLVVQFQRDGQTMFQSNLVAIDPGKPYSVFLYLGPIYEFKYIFSPERLEAPKVLFDSLTLTTAQVSLFDVQPTTVNIQTINCVD